MKKINRKITRRRENKRRDKESTSKQFFRIYIIVK